MKTSVLKKGTTKCLREKSPPGSSCDKKPWLQPQDLWRIKVRKQDVDWSDICADLFSEHLNNK